MCGDVAKLQVVGVFFGARWDNWADITSVKCSPTTDLPLKRLGDK